MKTIKIINGKVYLCQEIEANCAQAVEYKPVAYDAAKLQNCVRKRMQHCMEELQWSIDHNLIVDVMDVDSLGKHYRYLSGESFVTASYEAMERLMVKLEPFASKGQDIPATWLEENLDIIEASQLFKACVTTLPYWGVEAERLHAVVEILHLRGKSQHG